MNREQVYEIIGYHYSTHFKEQVKKLSNIAGGWHNAEDIVQEAYVRACQYWDTFNGDKEDFNKWFSVIRSNCAYDFLKEERRHGMADSNDDILEADAFDKVYTKDISALIDSQPTHLVNALKLYFIEGHTANEVSAMTGLSMENIWQAVFRFRNKLKVSDG